MNYNPIYNLELITIRVMVVQVPPKTPQNDHSQWENPWLLGATSLGNPLFCRGSSCWTSSPAATNHQPLATTEAMHCGHACGKDWQIGGHRLYIVFFPGVYQWLFLVPVKGGRWHIIPQLMYIIKIMFSHIPIVSFCDSESKFDFWEKYMRFKLKGNIQSVLEWLIFNCLLESLE